VDVEMGLALRPDDGPGGQTATPAGNW